MERLRPSAIRRGTKVALDTVALVYFLERHPLHFKSCKEIFRKVESGVVSAVMSSLVFAELLVPAFNAGRKDHAREVWRLLRNFPNLDLVPVSDEISFLAAELRARYGLRTPDAIHAATAIDRKADVLVTGDRDFLRLGRELKVVLF